MRTIALPFVTFAIATLGIADTASAQRGGRGRPEEIQSRVAVAFVDVNPAEGEQATDLAATDLVRAASGQQQVTVLYLFDSGDVATMREQFERTMFGNDTMGLYLRCFHCGRVDIAKNKALAAKYGKQAPLFLVFGKDGKQVDDASMPGYKASGNALIKALEKAGNPVFKPSLGAVVKNYETQLRDLEQLLGRRKLLQDRQARTTGDDASAKQKRAEIDKDLKDLDDEQEKLLKQENELIGKQRFPAQDPKAVKLGGGRGGPGRGGAPGGGAPGGGAGGGAGGGRPGG